MKIIMLQAFIILCMMVLMVLMAGSMSGCQHKPPDFNLCVEMSLARGECIKVMSGEKVHVDEDHKLHDKTWWQSRPTNLIIPFEDWMDIKKWIIDLCKQNQQQNMCDKNVSTWERSIQTVDQFQSDKSVPVSTDAE